MDIKGRLGGRGGGAASRHDRSFGTRAAWAIAALLGALGVVSAILTHPMGFAGPTLAAVLATTLMLTRREAWLVVMPALLPVADLVPWTGQMFWTESDSLVLCALVAIGLREAHDRHPPPRGGAWRLDGVSIGLIALMALSYFVSTAWIALGAMGVDPNLLVGYDSELNGVRVAKGFVLALALVPALTTTFRRDSQQASRALSRGMVLGAVLVATAAIWERVAFPGLSDFAADYRTTALFWEMSVGGAQLDGWLALSLPFVLWAVLRSRSPTMMAGFGILLAIVVYAVFTSFSRGLYAAAIVVTFVLVAFHARQPPVDVGDAAAVAVRHRSAWLLWAGLAVAIAITLLDMFKTSGYRGVGALIGLAAGAYFAGPISARVSWRSLALSVVVAGFASFGSFVMMAKIVKGPYFAYVASVGLVLALAMAGGRSGRLGPFLTWAALLWSGFNVVLVAGYWGGSESVSPAAAAVLLTLAPVALARTKAIFGWRPTPRGGLLLAVAFGASALVAVTLSTHFSTNRLASIGKDFGDRQRHWAKGIELVESGQQWLGVGTGRFAAAYFWNGDGGDLPGNHRLAGDEQGSHLRLGGPRYSAGHGELYRVVQRVDGDLVPPLSLSFRARSPGQAGALFVEVCRRHLIYTAGCTTADVGVPAGADWVSLTVHLDDRSLGRSPGFPPRLTAFAMANAKQGRTLDVDEVSLTDATGRELIINGGFERGATRWFFSSDRHHLPWHAKNILLHYWIEQGWLGVIAFVAVTLTALARLLRGRAVGHCLSPPLLAGILAFLVVGAFDSLVDAPRLALMLFVLLFIALGLRRPRLAA